MRASAAFKSISCLSKVTAVFLLLIGGWHPGVVVKVVMPLFLQSPVQPKARKAAHAYLESQIFQSLLFCRVGVCALSANMQAHDIPDLKGRRLPVLTGSRVGWQVVFFFQGRREGQELNLCVRKRKSRFSLLQCPE